MASESHSRELSGPFPWDGQFSGGLPKRNALTLSAVLSPHGHWPEGLFYDAGLKSVREQIATGAERYEVGGRYPLQARCVQLARMGCVVFHYDIAVGFASIASNSRSIVLSCRARR